MELNKVYHMDFLSNTLPDNCANLIIADPSYFEVKGEFDFVWKDFDHYLSDVEKWVVECKRLLRENGTLYWYGSSKNIAYAQIILDKYFGFLANITVHVYDRQTNRVKTDEARSFINTTERILMHSNDVYSLKQCPFLYRDYMREEIIKSKGRIDLKKLNEVFGTATNGGGVSSACFSLKKQQPTMISREMYLKLQSYLNEGLSERKFLLKNYDEIRRPFNPKEQFKMDVLRISQEGSNSGKYDHETVKPEKLTRILIQTSSLEGDLVVVPFSGSGTECSMSVKEKRKTIGFDIDIKHVKTSNKRIQHTLMNPSMF